MQSVEHVQHVKSRTSYQRCSECRADTERRFVCLTPWKEYQHVHSYLEYVRPRLAACATDQSVDARVWHRDFLKAMHRRISLRAPSAGRKYCDSYLERLQSARRGNTPASYLWAFAQRGASALDS